MLTRRDWLLIVAMILAVHLMDKAMDHVWPLDLHAQGGAIQRIEIVNSKSTINWWEDLAFKVEIINWPPADTEGE